MLDLPPFGDPQVLFGVPLQESSGVAVAGDRVWTHGDSGQDSTVTVLDRGGRTLEVLDVDAPNTDWEDLALVDGDLWIADTGDNRAVRDEVQVHRLDATGGPVTTYRFRYADGPVDAEALLVLPGRVALVSKELLGGGVFTAPLDASAPQVLERVAAVRLPLVTGGAVSPDGTRLLLRTYAALYEWPLQADLAATFAQGPSRSELPFTRQGEAVAYDGPDAVVTTAEGEGSPVHRLVRRPAASAAPTAATPVPPLPSAPPAAAPAAAPDGAPGTRRVLVVLGAALVALAGLAAVARRR